MEEFRFQLCRFHKYVTENGVRYYVSGFHLGLGVQCTSLHVSMEGPCGAWSKLLPREARNIYRNVRRAVLLWYVVLSGSPSVALVDCDHIH